jgi:hypothetical protein
VKEFHPTEHLVRQHQNGLEAEAEAKPGMEMGKGIPEEIENEDRKIFVCSEPIDGGEAKRGGEPSVNPAFVD